MGKKTNFFVIENDNVCVFDKSMHDHFFKLKFQACKEEVNRLDRLSLC